ncbi:hypothetical protein L1077_07425 [Pseudoalteromonas luteoviolacea]|uniref:hypothetical protein n=1 Tax=Pseudoalteromonas luteoviolacea TaxID=43657 RepID=UPI001F1E29B6|nr:hypothetical protein [Pseudoalteromonas luteoviolacea]MCF6439255.1 hypothetical protein [Pseudoalteromonas luteoviolacea]
MSSRKHFKGIAYNLAQFCISRNNDLLGYWAIGQLYSFALEQGVNEVVIDVLRQEVRPQTHRFSELSAAYLDLMVKIAASNGARFDYLEEAVVVFMFDVEYQSKYHWFGSALGKPFLCVVELTSDLGKRYSATLGCNIRPHDPNREYRREHF